MQAVLKGMGVKRSPTETVKRPTGGLLKDGRVTIKEETAVQWKLRRKSCPNGAIFKPLSDTAKMTVKLHGLRNNNQHLSHTTEVI